MRIVRLDETGPPENLTVVEVEKPEVTEHSILIRNSYAGIIYGDCEARRGTYYKKFPLPWFPGREVAGEIVAVGEGVDNYQVGQRVVALSLAQGGYSDYTLLPTQPQQLEDGSLLPPADITVLPEAASDTQALVYVTNYRIAHLLYHAWTDVDPGSTVLVHGAAGGMGVMIMELAHENNVKTIATVRSQHEADYCLSLGAWAVVDTTQEDYVERVAELTEGRGVTHSFNGVGGSTTTSDIFALAPKGEILLYGYVAGKEPFDPFALETTMALKTFNADTFLGTPAFDASSQAMARRFEAGGLLEVGNVFPLADVAAAHRAIEEGAVKGKVVLDCR